MPARAQVSPHARAAGLHGVVENDVLLGQFQQHGVVEELADAHILTQALQVTQSQGYSPYSHCPESPLKRPCVPQQDNFSCSKTRMRCSSAA